MLVERELEAKILQSDQLPTPAEIEIAIGASFDAPVSLALLLRDNGLGLAEAHTAVTELAARRRITLMVSPTSLPALLADLGRMGLVARG